MLKVIEALYRLFAPNKLSVIDYNVVIPFRKSIILYKILQEWIAQNTSTGVCNRCNAGLVNEERHQDDCWIIYAQELQKAIVKPEQRNAYLFHQVKGYR